MQRAATWRQLDCPNAYIDPREPPLFRPFTDADRRAYSGAESPDPRIAELPWGVVIVDGARVQAVLADDDLSSYARTFEFGAIAYAAALSVALLVDPTREDVARVLEPI